MLDKLRDRIISYLSQNRACVIATSGPLGTWAVAAQYDAYGLELTCRLPRWPDAIYYLEQEPRTVVIIIDAKSTEICWLEYRGIAHLLDSNDDRYLLVHIGPVRIDLIDESRGWDTRETLEL